MTETFDPKIVAAGNVLEGEVGAHSRQWVALVILLLALFLLCFPLKFLLLTKSVGSLTRGLVYVGLMTSDCATENVVSRSSNATDYSHANEVVWFGYMDVMWHSCVDVDCVQSYGEQGPVTVVTQRSLCPIIRNLWPSLSCIV